MDLYLTRNLHRAGAKVEGIWHDESKIMKYHVLAGYVDKILAEEFPIFKIKLSFLIDILLLVLMHGRRSRGAGGGGGDVAPSFCQIFAKSPFFASNLYAYSPSHSSQPPHFQIHSAVYVVKTIQ